MELEPTTPVPQTQVCRVCRKRKPVTKFNTNITRKDGSRTYRLDCKKCQAARIVSKRLGITIEEFYSFHKRTKRCEICHRKETNGRRLCIDHDHKTGQIRGLLCNDCNRKLGWFENRRDRVESYLQRADVLRDM